MLSILLEEGEGGQLAILELEELEEGEGEGLAIRAAGEGEDEELAILAVGRQFVALAPGPDMSDPAAGDLVARKDK